MPTGHTLLAGSPDAITWLDTVPLCAWDYDDMLAQAQTALERRRAAYPEWVQRGQIAADEADRDIRAWELLEAEWRWIVDGTGQLPASHTRRQRCDAIEVAMARVSAEISRRTRPELVAQAHVLQAMRWHLDRLWHGEPAVHHFQRQTRALRAEIISQAEAPAMPRRRAA